MNPDALARCTLLMVDDEPMNLDLLESILAPEGFEKLVRTADAREALPLFERTRPDLVLLDLHMPHRSGFEVLAEIRARTREDEYLPVLVLTADVSPEAKERALSGGAKDFLTKPLDAMEVCLRVRNLLETRLLYEEQRRARREAEAAERRAVVAAYARDRVLSVVAHDLRNPLASITAHAETLRLRLPPRAPPRQREGLARIEEIAQRTHALVQDLLEVSRLERDPLAIQPAPVPAASLLHEAEMMLAPLALRHAARLTFEGPSDLPIVDADAARMLQVFSNLVGNALKFTPAGGRVLVTWDVAEDELAVAVADSGPGISADQVPNLFLPFWQGDPSDRRGAGLGLVISRAVIEAHGGRIWLDPAPGAGATFRFTLPLSAPASRDGAGAVPAGTQGPEDDA
jgi:signal transduction histidine kinase